MLTNSASLRTFGFGFRLSRETQEYIVERLARLVMHHRRIVSAFWLTLFLAGGASAGQLSDLSLIHI